MNSLRALRQRCESLISDLEVPDPFDLDALCSDLGARRGRPLILDALPGPTNGDAPSGVWVALKTADVILVDPTTSPLHREHIVLHELGHMLCEHRPSPSTYMHRRLFPDLDPEMVSRVLGRTSYTEPEEREAEMIASLITSGIRRRAVGGDARPVEPQSGAEVLDRLTRMLGSASA